MATRAPAKTKATTGADKDNEPDFVDRVFEYLLAEFPQLAGAPKLAQTERALRERFGARTVWVRSAAEAERAQLAESVLALFNGRNATEVARRLRISRATVYRYLKQPGGRKSRVAP